MARDQIQDTARDENPYEDKRKWMVRWKYLEKQLLCWSRSKAKPRSQGLYHTKPESNELAPRRCNFLSHTTQKKRKMSLKILTCAYKNNSNKLHRVWAFDFAPSATVFLFLLSCRWERVEFVPGNSLRAIIPSHILTLTFAGDCGTWQEVKEKYPLLLHAISPPHGHFFSLKSGQTIAQFHPTGRGSITKELL